MRRLTQVTPALVALTLAFNGVAAPGDDITLRPVKYADLGKLVRDAKGKVVIVDFWAEF